MPSDDDDKNDDNDLWLHVTQSVKPIPREKLLLNAPKKHPRLAPPQERKQLETRIIKPQGRLMPPMPKNNAPPPNPGLDRRTEERLRRGKMTIDARLDLHGMTQDEAHTTLNRFITIGYERGNRCILVITGKGRSRNSEGILRRNVPEWLTIPPLRNLILRTAPARPQDGGEGALYVLLRRKRT